MVRLASAQSLGGFSALDELADLDPDGRQPSRSGRAPACRTSRASQLDDANRQSTADDRKGNRGPQARTALRARLVVVAHRQVIGNGATPDCQTLPTSRHPPGWKGF